MLCDFNTEIQIKQKIYLGLEINPHTPVADEVVFRRFQGEGVEFF